jgi:phage terminase small subunit
MTDDIEFGEAVNKLPQMKRRFVLALIGEVEPGTKAAMEAAEIAGYVAEPGRTLRRIASDLLKDRDVLAALKELGSAEVLAAIPAALATIREIMNEPMSKDRLKAAQLVLDRFMPAPKVIEAKVETINREQVTLDHLRHLITIGAGRDALIREFGELGLARYEKMLLERGSPIAIAEPAEATDKIVDLQAVTVADTSEISSRRRYSESERCAAAWRRSGSCSASNAPSGKPVVIVNLIFQKSAFVSWRRGSTRLTLWSWPISRSERSIRMPGISM